MASTKLFSISFLRILYSSPPPLNAPFANTINYSISSLPSNGGAYSVTAEFSDDNVCTATANYTAPDACLFCNITAATSAPACEGDDVNLTATDVAPGCTYSWTGPNGYTSNVQNPVLLAATAAMSGSYTATVVNPANNCTSNSTVVLAVFPVPAAPAIVSNAPVCPSATLQRSGPAPTAGATTLYTWAGPNGFTGTTQTVSVSSMQAAAAGDYTLVITENGCVSPLSTTSATLFPLPVPNAGPDVATCSAEAIQIGAQATPGFSYAWTPITGLDVNTLSNPTVLQSNTSGSPSNVTYTVTVSDANCSASDEVVVTINPQPTASFLTPAPQCFDGNSFNFDAEGSYSAGAQFEWSFGPFASPASSINESPLNVSFSSTGQQNVSLKITDNGCESTLFQAPVTVYEMPVANFDADSYEGCDPKLITFSNLTSSNDPISSYQWTFGGGRGSSLENPEILFNNAGNFDVSLTATSSRGCRNTYRIQGMIRINPTPVADFNMSPSLMTIIDPHTYIKDMSVGSDIIQYKVTKLDDIFQPNPKITFPDTGTYFITQIVETQFGCIDSTVKEAVVEFGFKVYIPNTFTPNDDGNNDRFRPYGEDIGEYSIEIYNRWGQLLYTSYDMENGWDGRSGLSNKVNSGGLYIYKISAFDKRGVKTNYEGTVVLLK
jgi:gliding motility-associated-like protein